MLSAMLLWGLVVEVLALGALGRDVLGWSWGATVALVLGAMLLGRALTMAVTWLVAWRHPSAAPPLRAGQRLAMVLREYGAFVRGFVLVQPWVWLGMPADRLRASAQPMLLVHGYGCNRGIWWWLRPRLGRRGTWWPRSAWSRPGAASTALPSSCTRASRLCAPPLARRA